MDLFSIGLLVAGILLLVIGRRLFWLCAALVGFAIGINFGIDLFNSPLLAWGMAIVFALIGAWLATKIREDRNLDRRLFPGGSHHRRVV